MNVAETIRNLRIGAQLTKRSRWPSGRCVLDREWDLLVVLDACRADTLRAVDSEYPFIDGVETYTSVGSSTPEWIANTFVDGIDLSDIAYLSANGYSDAILERGQTPEETKGLKYVPTRWRTADASDLGHLEHVWRYADTYDETEETYVSANVMTDRAIALGREEDFDRLIVHYIQPHVPYVQHARDDGRSSLTEYESRPFSYLRQKNAERGGFPTMLLPRVFSSRINTDESAWNQVWDAYLHELRVALDGIEVLLENYDAETAVITADHGEAFGEFGVFGHPVGSIHPHVHRVPWVETTASDEGTQQPEVKTEPDAERKLADHLEALGYKS